MRVYESIIKIGASIAKALTTDTKSATSALKNLADATKKMKEAEKAAASYKKLEDVIGKSKAKYDQAAAALHRLKEAEDAAGGATKESTKWRKAGERAVAKAAREMDRATKSAEKNGKALRDMGVDTANLAKEQERLAKTLAATERQEKSLGRYEASRERLFGKRKDAVPLMQKAGGQISGIARDAALLGTAAAGATAAMAGLVLKTLRAGDEIGDTAEKLGVGSTALQELRYGAKQSGDELGYIDKALGKMLITVGKFKQAKGKGSSAGGLIPGLTLLGEGGGGAQAADPFKKIGLNAKQLATLKPEEQLKKIADGMLKLKTQADRAAVAAAIFGKGAKEIDPFLKEGSAGIDKLSKAAHKYGGVLSVDAVKAADAADKAMKDAEMAFIGVANTLGAELLPTATKVFKEFSEWVAANRGEIKQWAENIATWITSKGIPAIMKIGAEAKAFGDKVVWLVGGAAKLVGGFDNLAIAVAALRLAPLATTLGKIGIEGLKAAAAMFRLAAANKAANAAGAGEVGPAVAQTGSLAKYVPVVGTAIAAGLAAQQLEVPGLGGLTFGDIGVGGGEFNAEAFKKLATDRARAAAGGGGRSELNINAPVNVGVGVSREQLAGALDQQNQFVLRDFDSRVSFGE